MRDIKPNAGIRSWYRKQLEAIVKEIDADIRNTILKEYKEKQKAREIATDGIMDWVGHAMDLLVERWSEKLLGLGGEISRLFASKSMKNYDRAFKRALKGHGFTVDLKLTDYTKEAAQASISVNTALIRSIGNQYLEKVQMHVWEAVGAGMDAGQLSKNLQRDFGVAKRRANFIARDQVNKVNSSIEHARRQEIGITEAIWRHTGSAKEPRQSHIRANGKRYDVRKGLLIDGKYIFPGQEINCGCTSMAVLPWESQGHIEQVNTQRKSA